MTEKEKEKDDTPQDPAKETPQGFEAQDDGEDD